MKSQFSAYMSTWVLAKEHDGSWPISTFVVRKDLLQRSIPPRAPGEYQEDLKHGEGGIVGSVQEWELLSQNSLLCLWVDSTNCLFLDPYPLHM